MNIIHSIPYLVILVKTVTSINKEESYSQLTLQWLVILFFQIICDIFGQVYSILVLSIIAEYSIICLKQTQIDPIIKKIENFPTEKILTEMKYSLSYMIVASVSKLFKCVFVKLIESIENQNLTDERQSKISQQLIDVTQFIETETQNRCNKSQMSQTKFLDQTLNLNYTVIEKHDDYFSNTHEILKELDFDNNRKEENQVQISQQLNEQQISSQNKLPPQQLLKGTLDVQKVNQQESTQKQRVSISGLQKNELNSMRNTLEKLKSDRKPMESNLNDATENRIKSAKNQSSAFDSTNDQIFQKLQQCKEKIIKQQNANIKLLE